MKVIIIGSGIAGLVLALVCQKKGIKVTLYDKAKQLQNIGGGILLWPHGLRYLQWLGISECLDLFHISIKSYDVINHVGEKIFNESYAKFYEAIGGTILPIDRSILQKSLVQQLETNTLQLNKHCIQAISSEKEAQVFFSDGTCDSADIIIGADGIHSGIREVINPHAKKHYTNYCWWGGIFDAVCTPFLSIDTVYMALNVAKMCMVWPTHGSRFMWYLPVKISQEALVNTELSTSQLFSICREWHTEIQQIIEAPSHTQRFSLPIYALPPQEYWSHQRIVLIGDAAHALGPILGQGASQAIEDVYVLIHFLKQIQSSTIFNPTIFKKYEALRLKKYQKLAELETQAAEMLIHDELESLESFQQQIQTIDLITMYQALIPLVNEESCLQLQASISEILGQAHSISAQCSS